MVRRRHVTHFGVLEAETDGRSIRGVTGWRNDPDPRRIIHNVADSQHHPARVRRPAVRRGWLEKGPGGGGRGDEPFVEIEWDAALELVSNELRRVYRDHGSGAVYGASYGWASAGRFHHTQSQIHRFLNTLGGYVAGIGDYSYGTSGALMPHILGTSPAALMGEATTWDVICEHTELFISFGGLSQKNSAVGPGGIGEHSTRSQVRRAREAGCHFIDVSPIRDDAFAEAGTDWLAPLPGSDAALMLALAFVLDQEKLADTAFLESHTVGYERFISYVRGETDGEAKDPRWAAQLTGLPADTIVDLARRMARSRTMINLSWSMQRQDHGEQPIWLGITLAAMLGMIGMPG